MLQSGVLNLFIVDEESDDDDDATQKFINLLMTDSICKILQCCLDSH